MGKQTETRKQITEQIDVHKIEFGQRYRDTASGFEGKVTAIYFFEHGCMRVNLRGTNKMTGDAIENTFDAPELELVVPDRAPEPVPPSTRKGGPHDLAPVSRPGPR